MLDVNFIRENFDLAKAGLEKRNIKEAKALLQSAIDVDDNRKKTQFVLDGKLEAANKLSKSIGQLFKEGKAAEADELKAQTAEIKEEINTLQQQQQKNLEMLDDVLVRIPNIPHESVPMGKSDADNEVIRTWGEEFELPASANLPHWELARSYKLFDLELGVKLTGAGFPVYTGQGAKLQRALINFFLNQAIDAGYTEVIPPLMVNADSAKATGQLPDKEGQMYEMKLDPFYMIPTAEVPITNIYRSVTVKDADFPIKMVGYTPCFRREAGSYGKDVRGLNRLHQFDKIEIVQVAHPNSSMAVLEEMVAHVEGLVQALELPYRVLRLCGGDLTFTSTLTYDIEVWSAAQKRWLEVSSISNFLTYQARRLQLRYKGKDGEKGFAHTLNGSALALPRIVAALLENHQKDGYIKIPKALQDFLGTDKLETLS